MLNFVLIDDNPDHHSILTRRLNEICDQLHADAQVALMTTDYRQVLAYAAAAEGITVYFVDIELNQEITGIELCHRIRKNCPSDYVVYVSAYQQYALDCCRSHAFDFLLKPLMPEQLKDCIASILHDIRFRAQGTIIEIPVGTKQVMLQQEDVVYFFKDHANLNAVCQQGNIVTWRENLGELQARLSPDNFLQCHKSYIVNRRYIREFRWGEDLLVLKNGATLPISRRRSKELRIEETKGGTASC